MESSGPACSFLPVPRFFRRERKHDRPVMLSPTGSRRCGQCYTKAAERQSGLRGMIHASRILVPVNGNRSDVEVLELACEIAQRSKAQVYAIHVIEVNRTLPLDAELQEEAERGEDLLNQAEQVGDRLGVTIHTDLLQARDVGSAIVDEVLERGIDLVIVGMILKKRFGEFGLGATLPYVLKNAPCRVWVCRQAI